MIVKSFRLSQSKFKRLTPTFGEKVMQFILNEKLWVSKSPSSEVILEVKVVNEFEELV